MALLAGLIRQPEPPASVTRNGMTVSWVWESTAIEITLQAPASGWVAAGFNPAAGLSGTSLIMARVRGGRAEAADYYVLRPGNYQPVTAMGGKSAVSGVRGREENGSTSVTFRLEARPGGPFHHSLAPGQEVHLLMAYSLDDDFAHHSIMRTSVRIRL
jgi:hypothetical protein